MQIIIRYTILAVCMPLFLQSKVSAQTHNGNLHETVTHRQGSSAKVEEAKNKNNTAVPTSNRLSQENRMPQNDKDFGDYAGMVTIFKHYITVRLPELDRSGLSHGMPFSTYDYKQWTKNDLRILATAYNGVEMFEGLVGLRNAAIGESASGKPLTEYQMQCAQNALTELKPNSCKSWKSFFNLISDVADATEAKRAELKERKKKAPIRGTGGVIEIDENTQGMLIDLEKFKDVAGSPLDNPAFDQQAALQTLKDKEIVLTDAAAGEKKPLETLVTDAVKNIKGAVRAA